MKVHLRYTFLLATLFLAFHTFARQGNPIIAVSLPDETYNQVKESIDDMVYWLNRATGEKFDVNRGGLGDISLVATSASSISSNLKKQLSKEGQTFYLKAGNYRSVVIVGSGANAIINGIYTFLYELGFRWYMPGDNWAIVPLGLKNKKLSIEKVYAPHFQNRSYFGTGGLAAIKGLDPENRFKKDFEQWNRRNRISSDYATKGHMGQAFYSANKRTLDAHPEYLANKKVNKFGRIDITNENAVALFTDWALTQVKPGERFPIIGVDPADGSGGKDDALPSNMPGIKTWSDKYFWLANKVAEMAESRGIDARVHLYAYASHAALPGFELNEHVYPVIIPYAFQDVAEPEEYIRLWQRKLKGRPMGIYDYWNITQWSSAVPQFNIYAIPEKLRLWYSNNITTINLESTNSKGPMGHALWLTSQMMWNSSLSFDSLYSDFLNTAFGPAAPDIKRMYDRWSLNYQHSMEVPLSLADLKAASFKTNNPDILARINELKAYVHYLRLFYNYKEEATKNNYEELVQYLYSIHHLRLVQTSALHSRYIKRPKSYASTDEKEITKVLEKVQPISASAIESNYLNDLAVSGKPYSISEHVFDIKKASVKNTGKIYQPPYIIGKNTYHFYLPADRKINFKAGATENTILIVKDSEKNIVYQKEIKGTADAYENIMLNLEKGRYTISFGAYYRKSRLIFSEDASFFSSDTFYDNYRYPLIYVYVPKDVTEIIYRDGYGPGTNKRGNWIDPNGKRREPASLKNDIYRIEVPAAYRGRVWTLNIGHRDYELLNITDIFSLNPFEYKE